MEESEKRFDDSIAMHRRLMEWLGNQFEPPKTLAHYTSVTSAAAIIQSRKVFLFNALTLNDEQEIDHALDFIGGAFGSEPLGRFGDLVGEYLEWRKNSHPSVYVFSLSEMQSWESLDKLSMWRAYGDDGNGLALAIKAAALTTAVSDTKFDSARLMRVLYGVDEKIALLEKLAEQFENECKQAGYKVEDMADALQSTLWQVAPIFKHEAFREEREWRLVLQITRSWGSAGGDADKINFAADGRPYVPVALNELPGKDLLSRLDAGPFLGALIGPSKNARRNAGVVGAALLKVRSRFRVEKSTTPYRGKL